MGNVVTLDETPNTRTYVVAAKNPELNGLRVTVKPNGGTIMREVGKLAKKRRIAINFANLDPEGAYENALLTSEVLVQKLERVKFDERGQATDEVVETLVEESGSNKAPLRALLEKYDGFARQIRTQGEALQDEIEGASDETVQD